MSNNKRTYYPNRIIEDERLPFSIELTVNLTPYIRKVIKTDSKIEDSQVLKPDAYIVNKRKTVLINHEGFTVNITGYNEKTNKFVYTIRKVIEA